VSDSNRLKQARSMYRAYESGEREVVEELLSEDFTFYSPADVGIDRARYFERCWPCARGCFYFLAGGTDRQLFAGWPLVAVPHASTLPPLPSTSLSTAVLGVWGKLLSAP
jgi:hypothetical protein